MLIATKLFTSTGEVLVAILPVAKLLSTPATPAHQFCAENGVLEAANGVPSVGSAMNQSGKVQLYEIVSSVLPVQLVVEAVHERFQVVDPTPLL
jgi:hypothetical protein